MIPEELLQFLRDHIDSVEQLEILILLCQKGDREWTADEMARELRSSPSSVAKRLEEFAAKKFIKATEPPPRSYRYAPADESVRKRIAELSELYKVRRVTVIDTIFSKPVDKIKVFADAFKFRKE